ncbi:hypothetical protein Syun_027665 [Stephania yunnanensis]|uniref:Uncharacterized protein n=1 Tax=Stephania yunnanensis TaxID=152371 RepID=A0AAP0EPW3_9MAGN
MRKKERKERKEDPCLENQNLGFETPSKGRYARMTQLGYSNHRLDVAIYAIIL